MRWLFVFAIGCSSVATPPTALPSNRWFDEDAPITYAEPDEPDEELDLEPSVIERARIEIRIARRRLMIQQLRASSSGFSARP